MDLSHFKEMILKPKKEIPLYQTVEIEGVEMLLLSITGEKYGNHLWVLCESQDVRNAFPKGEGINATNRDMLAPRQEKATPFCIGEITLLGKKLLINGGSSNHINHDNQLGSGIIQFTHFLKSGRIENSWLRDKKLTLYCLEIRNIKLPKLNKKQPGEIILTIQPEHMEGIIGQKYNFPLGQQEKGVKYFYKDPYTGGETYFYLDKVELFDPWDEEKMRHNLQQSGTSPSEEEIAQLLDAYKSLCPEGMVIPLAYYETEDGRQLRFFTTQYLDSLTDKSSSSSFGAFYTSGKEDILNGQRPMVCDFQPVKRDSSASLAVELLSCHLYREPYERTIPFVLKAVKTKEK